MKNMREEDNNKMQEKNGKEQNDKRELWFGMSGTHKSKQPRYGHHDHNLPSVIKAQIVY